MNVKQKRARQGGVDEVFVDRVAEAVHYGNGDQQRHEEVKIFIQHASAAGSYGASAERVRFDIEWWRSDSRHLWRNATTFEMRMVMITPQSQ